MSGWVDRGSGIPFIFRGNAVTAGGYVRDAAGGGYRPFNLASLSLPMIGGLAQDEVRGEARPSERMPILTLKRGGAAAQGQLEGSSSQTFVATRALGVSVGGIFHADAMAVTLASRHYLGHGHEADMGHVIHLGNFHTEKVVQNHQEGPQTEFSVHGKRMRVIFDPELLEHHTLSSLENRFRDDGEFRKRYTGNFMRGKSGPTGEFHLLRSWGFCSPSLPKHKGSAIYTIVKRIEWVNPRDRDDRVQIEGNTVLIEGFGQIRWGEVVRSSLSCRFALCRFTLDDGSDIKQSPRGSGQFTDQFDPEKVETLSMAAMASAGEDGEPSASEDPPVDPEPGTVGEGLTGGIVLCELESNGMDIDPDG
jgi:hypothetical protein